MSFFVSWLVEAARSTGYPVVALSGWESRGHGGMRVVEGVVGHHTATAQTAPGDYPSLGVVTNGRSDLAGPLANFGLGRNGTIYVIAAGLTYHAGASRWAGFTDLNDEFLGIEAESAGTGVWTDAQRDCYPKLVAALLRYMRRGTDRYAGHKDVCVPTGRKIDPVGIDTQWLRDRAAHPAPTPAPTLEELMKSINPCFLPKAAEWTDEVAPVEVGKLSDGGNSTVVAALWLVLGSSNFGDPNGSTEYRVWAGDDAGNYIGFGDGSDAPEGTLEKGGAIKGNDSRTFVLKKGTRILTVSYRNNGRSKAGYSFPQISQ